MTVSAWSFTGILDVLVVGAGPAGLCLAGQLCRAGFRVAVIDQLRGPAVTSRALAIQPATLDALARLGLADRLVRAGTPITCANVYVNRQRLRVDLAQHLGGWRTAHPYVLLLPQAATERVLATYLFEHGGSIFYGWELLTFEQDDAGVVATIRAVQAPGASVRLRARYLAGCDGAHSRVRKVLGVPFKGSAYSERFVLADVTLAPWGHSHAESHVWVHPDGLLAALPLPGDGQWRLIATRACPAAAPPIEDVLHYLLTRRSGDASARMTALTWVSSFTIHRRCAAQMRVKRAFLLGDAARVHSPLGGQGMNTALQDALGLAWRLSAVLRGQAGDSLLETFPHERSGVAGAVLRDTHILTRVLTASSLLARAARASIALPLLRLPAVQARLVRVGAQLHVAYRSSPLSLAPPPGGGSTARLLGRLAARRIGTTALQPGDRAHDGPCVRLPGQVPTTLFEELPASAWTVLLFMVFSDN